MTLNLEFILSSTVCLGHPTVSSQGGCYHAITGAREATNWLWMATMALQEEEHISAHGVSGAAVNFRLEAVQSCAQAHGEPDFHAHFLLPDFQATLHDLTANLAAIFDPMDPCPSPGQFMCLASI